MGGSLRGEKGEEQGGSKDKHWPPTDPDARASVRGVQDSPLQGTSG